MLCHLFEFRQFVYHHFSYNFSYTQQDWTDGLTYAYQALTKILSKKLRPTIFCTSNIAIYCPQTIALEDVFQHYHEMTRHAGNVLFQIRCNSKGQMNAYEPLVRKLLKGLKQNFKKQVLTG